MVVLIAVTVSVICIAAIQAAIFAREISQSKDLDKE